MCCSENIVSPLMLVSPMQEYVSLGESVERTAVLLFLLSVSGCLLYKGITSTYWHGVEEWPCRLHPEYTSRIHACEDDCKEQSLTPV